MKIRYKKVKLVLVLCGFYLLTINCFSQSQVIFNKINQSNGLSSNRVTGIIKENNGFVWIGTENGLNRFDGKQFKIYNSQNSSISSNNISDVLLDSKGRIWVATLGGGLNLYSNSSDDFVVYKNDSKDLTSLPSNQLYKLFEDSNGNLWIGSENGLCLFVEASNLFITYHQQNNNNTSHNIVTSIYEDTQGDLWIGTFGHGLNKFSMTTKMFKHIESETSIFNDFVHTISQLNEDVLLVGTSGSGLLMFDLKTHKFENFFKDSNKLSSEITIVRSLFKDKKNDLWVGTDGNGIIKIEKPNSTNPEIYNFTHKPQLDSSLSGNAVYVITEDEQANIWIGTAWNGINILPQKNNFELIPSDIMGLYPIPVLSIYKNKKDLYLGLDGKGLTVFNTETNEVKQFNKDFKNSIGGDYIQCIYESKSKILWIGTYANGIIKFNPKTNSYIQYKHESDNPKSLSFNDVRTIIEDDKNNLWVASWGGGLNYFDTSKNEFTAFRENKNDTTSISSDNIVSMIKDGTTLWLGTYGGGINLFNTSSKKATRLKNLNKNQNSIDSDNILSLLKDSKGNIWIGDSEGGINRFDFDTKMFNRFETNNELNNQSEVSLIEDDNGNIWFSTEKGIGKYDYDINDFKSFPNFAGSYRINSVFKDESGILYFGRSDGVLKFNPKNILYENIQPQVKITNFKLFNKDLPVGENEILTKNITLTNHISLRHDSNVITFEFAALQFPFSYRCEYAIQMEGFDKDWRNIGTDRTVTYTNLSPGNYNFKVKSKESGSKWGDDFTSMNIYIQKPFWLEWWAIVLYILFALFVLYLFRKYTVAWEQLKTNLKLEKLTHEKDIELYNFKQQFFTNISHDIRTPVTLILGSINRLLQGKEEVDDDLSNSIETIKKNGNKLVNLVNELLDHRKLEFNKIKLQIVNENLVEFCEEIYLSFKEMALEKGIHFNFKTNTDELLVWFDKNQLEKVLYNLLSNSFKFTKTAETIEFSLFDKEDIVEIHIKDKGIGIAKRQLDKIFNRFYQTKENADSNTNGFGLGLTISKEIIDLHHGEIVVDSIKGKGTEFVIKLKKGESHFTQEQINGDKTNSLLTNYFKENLENQKNNDLVIKNENTNNKNPTLLIVEDNTDIRDYIVGILSNEYNIIEASNGEEALQLVFDNSLDLIISDVMMPIMDGITLTKELKANVRTSHIPILLLTARASFTHKIEGFEIGADDYITKPFNELLLRSRIKNILKNRNLLHEKFWMKELIPISELNLNKSDEEFMNKLMNILEENLDSADLNVNFVCDELGMSHSVVYKKIKSLTNMSYVEFVRDFKLKTAKKLIEEQNFSVLDASYHVGYSDRKYFSKLFKKHFGKAPSEYLKKS
ncbi:hybrid sensor histidine kinase/response regulator transcription factor [Litoribaculum gwangyangense]|uniref:histidine kinase n=1 Tax=Litoribaculum gwangyangense TaxID=1130722 RepID=A0ABP9CP25_9FLAO